MSYIIGKSEVHYINSANRNSGEPEDFTINIKHENRHVNMVCLKGASIPKTWYNVLSGYNTFSLIEDGKNYTITVPPGDYSLSVLKTTLNELLTSATNSSYTYVVDNPSQSEIQTGKFTFTTSGGGGQPSLVFSGEDLYDMLGFAKNSTNTFVANTLTSTNCVQLSRNESVLLISDLIQSRNEAKNVLHMFFPNGAFGSFIHYQCPDILGYSKPIEHLSTSYNFKLTDPYGRILSLNGRDYQFTLIFYELNNIHHLQKMDIETTNFEKLYQNILSRAV